MWILGSKNRDLSFFFLPGVMGLILSFLFQDYFPAIFLPVYLFVIFALIDSGHVYTTLWRTPIQKKYFLVISLIFLTSASLYHWHYQWLWKIVVYLTLFHHLRQNYGMSRWYQRLNKRMCRVSDFFFYTLTILPIAYFHFRTNVTHQYYTGNDLFLFDQPEIQQLLLLTYFLFFLAWIVFELRLKSRGIHELNRSLVLAFYFMLYGVCFFFGTNTQEILVPLLLVHGITYFGVMGETLKGGPRLRSFYWALLAVLGTALVFGSIEAYFEENHIDFTPQSPSLISSIGVGLYLTPLLFHYFLDSIIWRRKYQAPH